MTAGTSPWNAEWHLRAEMTRIVEMLGRVVSRQRERGRSSDANALSGLVIEPGEAEGLVNDLAAFWSGPNRAGDSLNRGARGAREEISARAALGEANGCFLPLRRAVAAFDLSEPEYDAVLLALGVELDSRFGRLVAFLNDHVGQTRATLGLAATLAEMAGSSLNLLDLLRRPVIRDGLVELDESAPAPGMTMRLDSEMAARLAAASAEGPRSQHVKWHRAEHGSLERLVLAAPVRERLGAWARGLRDGPPVSSLLLAGAPGTGRTAAAVAAAAAAGCAVVEVSVRGEGLDARLQFARREAVWYGAALLLKVDAEAAQAIDWSLLWRGVQGQVSPVIVEVDAATAEAAAVAADEEPLVVVFDEPGIELRTRMWQSLLPPNENVEVGDLERLAAAFHFPPAQIARAIRRARAESCMAAGGGRPLTARELENACRAIGSAAMGSLAQRLPSAYRMSDLVVPDTLRAELELAVAWVRQQRPVMERWGFGLRIPFGRGLTALFSGPPGTGKTMAAQVLARELNLDLYRIDLSRVMNKYIGETEKNLARLFDEAHASGAILFFDEADAIFGKRTEVKDAHDRYANVEIGYLLQRMEEHDGVTVLATNRLRDMDEAFIRRFHFILNFPMPGEPDRLRIWEGMFPAEAERDRDLDLRPLARHFEISGGEIRNIVLAAAFLASAEGRPIEMVHIKYAVRREMAKNGRVLDERTWSAL